MRILTLVSGMLLSTSAFPAAGASVSFTTEIVSSPTEQTWKTLSATSDSIIWLGSETGYVAVTDTAGERWEISRPGGRTTELDIRQIIALDDRQAYALTMGRGNLSRLFQTRNAGFGWRQHYRGSGDEHFRCFDLIPDGEGWILADAIDDNWHVVRSSNGSHWLSSRTGFSERSLPGEQGSAFGDSCVRYENATWAMGTKNSSSARLIYKSRTALRFNVVDSPITAGPGSGIHAVWPLSAREILIAGGSSSEGSEPELYKYNNGSFIQIGVTGIRGALENLVVNGDLLITGNRNGLVATTDMGANWHDTGLEGVYSLSCVNDSTCYAVNVQNEVIRLSINWE